MPWRRVLAESVVIVASILLAFALDAWWDDRSREAELRGQLEVVAGEMESTHQALQRALNAHDLNAHLAEHLASVMVQLEEGTQVVVSDTLVGPLFPQVTADLTTESLEAFIAAGGLELIDDGELRRQLLGWPTRIEDLLDDEIYLRNFAAADLASYLRANFSVANAELHSTPWVLGRFGAAPRPDADLFGTVTLRHDQRLMNLLAAREVGERGIRRGLVGMLEESARMVAALESQE